MLRPWFPQPGRNKATFFSSELHHRRSTQVAPRRPSDHGDHEHQAEASRPPAGTAAGRGRGPRASRRGSRAGGRRGPAPADGVPRHGKLPKPVAEGADGPGDEGGRCGSDPGHCAKFSNPRRGRQRRDAQHAGDGARARVKEPKGPGSTESERDARVNRHRKNTGGPHGLQSGQPGARVAARRADGASTRDAPAQHEAAERGGSQASTKRHQRSHGPRARARLTHQAQVRKPELFS